MTAAQLYRMHGPSIWGWRASINARTDKRWPRGSLIDDWQDLMNFQQKYNKRASQGGSLTALCTVRWTEKKLATHHADMAVCSLRTSLKVVSVVGSDPVGPMCQSADELIQLDGQ
jgi:hypothetical protein